MAKIETKLEIAPKLVEWKCECGGEVSATGITLLSNPAQYEHRCVECGKEVNLMRLYPYIEVVYLCDGIVLSTEHLEI